MVSLNLLDTYNSRSLRGLFPMQVVLQGILRYIFLLILFICPMFGVDCAEDRPIILLLLGPPGSGRDALAVKVSSSFSLPYVSTADLLLDYSDDDSDMGRLTRECVHTGCIPDDHLLRLISERISRSDCSRGFLLDGFPKTLEQARVLNGRFRHDYCVVPVYIRTSDAWLINFHEGRLVCKNCGRVYHLDRSPPQNAHRCDFCASELIQRHDDCPETLKRKTECYRDTILPLITYYSQEKLLVEIDGNRPFDDMFLDVKRLINSSKAR